MRTTIDIADPVLEEVQQIQQREDKTLGEVVSELLAEALESRRAASAAREFRWIAKPLGVRIDLRDRDALWAVLDRDRETL